MANTPTKVLTNQTNFLLEVKVLIFPDRVYSITNKTILDDGEKDPRIWSLEERLKNNPETGFPFLKGLCLFIIKTKKLRLIFPNFRGYADEFEIYGLFTRTQIHGLYSLHFG